MRSIRTAPVAKGERIPRWARPSLIIRDGRSMRPHNAGRPLPGDQVYIITTPRYLPLLDRLFGGPAAAATDDPRLYGEFSLDPAAKLVDIGKAYSIRIAAADRALTVAELFRRELAGDIEPGDRVAYGPVDLVVRQTDEDHDIEEVGLALEPSRQARPWIPVFQNRREIAAYIRAWRRKRARAGKAPVKAAGAAAPAAEPRRPGRGGGYRGYADGRRCRRRPRPDEAPAETAIGRRDHSAEELRGPGDPGRPRGVAAERPFPGPCFRRCRALPQVR